MCNGVTDSLVTNLLICLPSEQPSNYRTSEGNVFHTTRKSYSLRETECRRLKSIGASPYRIPGGTTTPRKKRYRRTPFPLIEENTKQILAQNLKKTLFLDDDNIKPKQPEESESQTEKENSCQSHLDMNVTAVSNDYSMELMTVSQGVVSECVENVCSSHEGHSKSLGGLNSDTCWTDVDDENVAGTSEPQEKRRRPLRRKSFVKSSTTLSSTVEKADPQKRLYRLLSYTPPPKNKYRSLAELSKDFETKMRAYTPPNLKAAKAQWTPTKPVSPKLTACKRKRTLTCVSHKEQEENIPLSIKKNTFKATPFNKKTSLSTVDFSVKRVCPGNSGNE